MTAVSVLDQRNRSLDVLRCLAVLLVLGFHFSYYVLWSRIGWIGVDLFFVLSGYLISGLLFSEYQKTGALSLKRFLIRRGLKIYPSYYFLVALSVAVSFATHKPLLGKNALVCAVFFQNYYRGMRYTMMSHTWSIAVEEHFYFFLPLLLTVLIWARRKSQDPFRCIPLFFAVVASLCLAFRWFSLPDGGITQMTHMRMDSLFAGVTLGYLHHFKPELFQKLTTHYGLALGVLLCLPTALLDQNHRATQTIGLTCLSLGFSGIVAWSVVRTPRSSLGIMLSTIAARIGVYSYSIYLWHTVVGEGLFHSGATLIKFWSYIASCLAAGFLMAHLMEIPYLRVRDRLFPARAVALPHLASAEVGTFKVTRRE